VLCADGKIVGVESAVAPVPEGWPVVEYRDATILPGLIDCHVHLCADSRTGALDRLPGYTDEQLGQVILTSLRTQLAAGVTTVRDLGDRRWVVLDWRDRVAAGRVGFPSPAIVASGPPITSPRGHCWHMGGEAGDENELRAAVRERAERRVDVIKVMASGGATTAGTDVLACQYTLEQLQTIVEEAHAYGLPVTAHAHGLPAVIQAVDAGVDGIEHCGCLTERGIEVPDNLLARLAGSAIVVCPTLGRKPGGPPPPAFLAIQQRTGFTWQDRQLMAGKLQGAGVRIASGVDAGINDGKPHGLLAHAIADLIAGGIRPPTPSPRPPRWQRRPAGWTTAKDGSTPATTPT
jgi:imidazolonepropionase-like amidohydrolase